jgi:YbbR domain-containing protein
LPPGFTIGEPAVEPETVTVTGPKTQVDTIVAVKAEVTVQPSGISIDQEVTPVAINAADAAVAPVSLDPPTVNVTVPVFQDVRNKTLPVTPVVTGQPAPGFEIASVLADPSVVTVAGDAEELGGLTSLETGPLSVNGATEDIEATVGLVTPQGVVPVDVTTVRVTITLRPVTITRTFESGLDLVGEAPGTTYELSVDSVLLTLGGSVADLDRLSGATIVGLLDVTELGPGTTDVSVTVDLPAGVTLVAASPATVGVTVSPPPSPTPAAVATPTPAP